MATYNAWGKIMSMTGNTELVVNNPFRYTGDITMTKRADFIISTAGIKTLRRVGLLALNQMLIRQSLMMESVYIALMFMLIVGIILSHTKMIAENLLFLYLLALAH